MEACMNFITENLQTPITDRCDVLVAGGGIAGVAAALAAARNGADVLLLERSYMLGGLATAGLITIYLPLCDGMGHQVSFGIAEELLRLSIRHGWESDYPDAWLDEGDSERRKQQRFQVRYNAQLCAILMEQLLRENGVRILYGATVCAMAVADGRAQAAIVESKSGRSAITARSFVDATGDADLFHLAGAPTENFARGNVLAAWYYQAGKDGMQLILHGASEMPDKIRTSPHRQQFLTDRRFTGLDCADLSDMTMLSHDKILEHLLQARQNDPTVMPATMPTTPQVRMTRRIVGMYTLHDEENDVAFPDSIGKIADWRRRGYVYDVPFRTLYGPHVKNLIAAGRCISVTDDMWDISRVIPPCAVTGEAAGTAAAMCDDFTALDVDALRRRLQEQGVRL